ncbi:WD40-repeat-containing domain protein, partial [Mycena latifolia]
IFWINGSAGTGKTTIASTVAKQCWDSDPEILGASFFCSRDDVECSNLSLIFPTLSYQLGIFNPLFASQVFRVLESNPDIAYASVHYQLEELIVKPLALVRDSFTRCIVILDALDECKDTATVSTVLSALSRFVMDLLPLKFLVTSRPETHITMGFAHPTLRPNTTQLLLHQVALPVVEADIHTYLSSRLATTRLLYKIQESWPPAGSVEALARLSAGLFIFASTSVKFIEDPFYSDPRHQLALLLENAPKLTGKSSPFHRLDQLYTEVLNLAYPDISHLHLRSLRTVLGSILHLRDPLSPTGLNSLLGLSIGRVKEALLRLHSLVIVPEDEEHCIRLIHPSFFDFLTDPARCAVPHFVVRFDEQNTLLALSCLRSLSQLSRDVCRIGKPWLLNSEVIDLPARITVYLPAHVQYASRHWAHHVSASLVSDIILDALDKFCSEHLLHWVEVCSLLGELRQALLSVGDLHRILLVFAKETLTLLRDCEHLIREFFPVISTSALQVYQSALLFAPDRALLQRTNDVEMDLQFWDASTGVHLQTMHGHSSTVTVVVFSPDGTRLLSGSKDTYVRLWDGGSGAHLWTFEGHSEAVESIAVCSTSSHIASGSQDRTIRLWDGDNGKHIRALAEHSGPVLALAFSLDGKCLASGSVDQTVRLWDVPDYGTHRILRRFPEWVLCIPFSSNGAHIAAGCSDQAVWICEIGSHRSAPRVLKAHAGRVTSVSFSPDDRNIASGSMDHTVRIWDSASGTNLLTLEKHSAWVQSVAFSPDGTRVISASEGKTIRMWDVTRSAHLKGLKGIGSILAFSPDGTRLAVRDREIKVLDVSTGGHLRTLP